MRPKWRWKRAKSARIQRHFERRWGGMDRSDVQRLDERDGLAGFRHRFVIADPGLRYMDGNSLGRLPKATVERLRHVVEHEWGVGLVRSWEEWMDLPTTVGDEL